MFKKILTNWRFQIVFGRSFISLWLILLGFIIHPVFAQTHFSFNATESYYGVIINGATIDGVAIVDGDEVGVFFRDDNNQLKCGGAIVWPDQGLQAWSDDSQTPEKDGFANGEEMVFQIWDVSNLHNLNNITVNWILQDGKWGSGAYAICSLAGLSSFPDIDVTITTDPVGRSIIVDGTSYTAPQTFTWAEGSQHILSTQQTQNVGNDTRYIFTHWSEGSGRTIIVTIPSVNTTYTANFATNYYLTTSVIPVDAGTISPASGWYNSGTTQQISAQPVSGSRYNFSFFIVNGDTAYQNPTSILIDAPKTVEANFRDEPPKNITITTDPPGLDVSVDGSQHTAPRTFSWQVGEQHDISVAETIPISTGERHAFVNWSDAGNRSHSITVPSYDATYTASFLTEYQLTTNCIPDTGGTILIDPPGDWFTEGTYVNLTANENQNHVFSNWSGDASGSSKTIIVRMDNMKSVTANFYYGGDVLIRLPSDLRGLQNSAIEIPILIQTETSGLGIISYQFTLNYDGSVLQATGVDAAGTLTDSWQAPVVNTLTSGQIQVGGYNTTELQGIGTLIKINFNVIGSAFSQSILQFSEFIFNSGSPTANTQNGTFTVVPPEPDISGYVYYHNGTEPVEYVNMNITGGGSSVRTIADGSYEFLDLTVGGNYTVTPTMTRFTHLSPNCIHSMDATLAARAVFGLENLTSMQTTAADVDKNGQMQMYDAALILFYAVIGPPVSADSYVGEWMCDPLSRTYSNLTTDQTNQNYEIIVLGDVNADWPNPPGIAKGGLIFTSLGEPISVEPGEEFVLSVPNQSEEPLFTVYMKVRFDPDDVYLKEVHKTQQTQDFLLLQRREYNCLTVGMLSYQPIVISGDLLHFVFTAKDKGQNTTISFEDFMIDTNSPLWLTQDIIIGGNPVLIKTFSVSQNYPNPFNPSTTISYSLPWETPQITSIKIYDITGKLVRDLQNKEQSTGNYQVTWDGLDAHHKEAPSGIYFCIVKSGSLKKTVKILKTK